jgi:hypothetical protein
LFAIFLSQCAALSEKIQMRMIYGRLSEAAGDGETGTTPPGLAAALDGRAPPS